MTKFWEDLSFDEALDEFRERLSELELNEEFFRLVLLKTAGRTNKNFLELVVERYENEIELLESQIQSYSFCDPKEFFQNLPPPIHREIVLPPDLQTEYDLGFKAKTEGLVAGLITEDAAVPSDQEGQEFCRTLPSPSQRKIVLPSDSQMEYNVGFKAKTEELVAGLITEDVAVPSNLKGQEFC